MDKKSKILNGPHDDLYDYAQRVMNKSLLEMMTPVYGLQMFGNAACIVIDRESFFQAELCIFPPGVSVPHHDHPDVDSIEIQITGSIIFFVNGKNIIKRNGLEGLEESLQKVGFRIPANADHNAEVGPRGVVFLSIQRWNNGKNPDHVGHNWNGAHYSDDQKIRLNSIKHE